MPFRPFMGSPILALLAALAVAGCAGRPGGAAGEASARIAVSASALATSIARVDVTVGPGTGTPTFSPIAMTLSQTGTTWSGFITGIPAGTGRKFDVVALDATGTAVAAGGGTADVVAGGTATVAIALSTAGPGTPYENAVPVIDSISASETLVRPGATVRLRVSAHDPDPNDTVSYAWMATCGSIASPASSSIDWVAPASVGSCQVSVAVSDNRGASAAAFLVVNLGVETRGGVLVTVTGGTGNAPVITGMAAQVIYADTITGVLMVNAVDPDGGAVTYAWSSDCTGITFDTIAPYSPMTPAFTSQETTRECALIVVVTDASGSQTLGVVQIGPPPGFNLAPVIVSTIQPTVDLKDPLLAEPVSPGDAVALGVLATDPEGQALTFLWTASAGTLDGQVDQPASPGKSTAVFHVPAAIPAGLQVTVTVTDPLGAWNAHVFRFKTAGP